MPAAAACPARPRPSGARNPAFRDSSQGGCRDCASRLFSIAPKGSPIAALQLLAWHPDKQRRRVLPREGLCQSGISALIKDTL